MADTSQFTIGTEASCSDGTAGKVSRVIVDPLAEKVTHLVIDQEHRHGFGRLVPLDLVDETAGEIRLRCTRAQFEMLGPAQETQFISATSGYGGYGYLRGRSRRRRDWRRGARRPSSVTPFRWARWK